MRFRATLFIIASLALFVAPLNAAPAKKPNILFLFADDQRADTIAALGNPVIKTPNLDSLAKSGFVFRNAYCLGGNVGAVCTPSRNMLLSGRAYFRWKGLQAPADQPNFPVALKEAGCVTYHHGKRGNVATEIQAKFDINKYLPNDEAERRSGEPGQFIVDDAIAFLKEKRDDKPFFMYLAFANPHDPRVAAQKYLDLYQRDKIPLPKNFMPLHPFDNGEMTIRDEKLAPFPRTEAEIRRHLHEYYAVISGLDYHIGRLLQTLKDLGLYDNTLIIYSADNGLSMSSHGLMGKQNVYEHSMKVPLIFAGPNIRKGQSDALVYLLDIFPTVCDFVGAPIPSGLDGKSLKPVITGKAKGVRDTLFLSYRDVQRAVRDERWKLIRYPHINKTQLFDLKSDPDELRNLAGDPRRAKEIERLMRALSDWQKQLGDTAPLTSATPHDPRFVPPQKEDETMSVMAPPESVRSDLHLSPFYKKFINVGGLPVISSEKVSDYALREAAHIVQQMLGGRQDVLKAIVQQKVRLVVMSYAEMITDIPEHSDLKPKDYWDKRARGLGATTIRPAVSCGEENLLDYPGDPYATENILIHEFGHVIHEMGMKVVDPTFDKRLKEAYDHAMQAGLWKDTYAATNRNEYWAEGVQSWFDTNRENDSVHNHVNTRAELKAYDTELAKLLTEVFGDGDWRYVKPGKRQPPSSHLAGYDPTKAPKFTWPERLLKKEPGD